MLSWFLRIKNFPLDEQVKAYKQSEFRKGAATSKCGLEK